MSGSALFSTADLTDLRAFSEANLPHTADVVAAGTAVDDGGGEYTLPWNVVEQNDLPCRFAPSRVQIEQIIAGAIREVKDIDVFFDVNVAVATTRRLTLTHDNPALPNPVTLEVTGYVARTYEMERKVLCSLVGGL